jgi:hypothetical protein
MTTSKVLVWIFLVLGALPILVWPFMMLANVMALGNWSKMTWSLKTLGMVLLMVFTTAYPVLYWVACKVSLKAVRAEKWEVAITWSVPLTIVTLVFAWLMFIKR